MHERRAGPQLVLDRHLHEQPHARGAGGAPRLQLGQEQAAERGQPPARDLPRQLELRSLGTCPQKRCWDLPELADVARQSGARGPGAKEPEPVFFSERMCREEHCGAPGCGRRQWPRLPCSRVGRSSGCRGFLVSGGLRGKSGFRFTEAASEAPVLESCAQADQAREHRV